MTRPPQGARAPRQPLTALLSHNEKIVQVALNKTVPAEPTQNFLTILGASYDCCDNLCRNPSDEGRLDVIATLACDERIKQATPDVVLVQDRGHSPVLVDWAKVSAETRASILTVDPVKRPANVFDVISDAGRDANHPILLVVSDWCLY